MMGGREPLPPMEPLPSLLPSNSTNGTMIGGAVATLIMYGLSMKGITFPAGVESAIAVLISALAGYLPRSGRRHVDRPDENLGENPFH